MLDSSLQIPVVPIPTFSYILFKVYTIKNAITQIHFILDCNTY